MYREKEDVCSGMTPRAVAFVYESDHHAALVDTPGQGQGKWCWMRVVGGTEREGGRETERERDFIRDVVHNRGTSALSDDRRYEGGTNPGLANGVIDGDSADDTDTPQCLEERELFHPRPGPQAAEAPL